MLVQFSVGNFLSFKEPVTMSMQAVNSIKEHSQENVLSHGRYKLLKSTVIYGANASGKSNLISAMRFMDWFIVNSSKESQADEEIEIDNFKLSSETDNKPSFFEIVFLIENEKFRYGFEVDKKRVKSEWLLSAKKIKEKELFVRDENCIEIFKGFEEGDGLEKKTRDNALFLSVVSQFNGEISKKVISWFQKKFFQISGLLDRSYQSLSINLLGDSEYKTKILEFITKADVGIERVEVTEEAFDFDKYLEPFSNKFKKAMKEELKIKLEKSTSEVQVPLINTLHNKFDDSGNIIDLERFDFDNEESEGTKKFFRISGPILRALFEGHILMVDELDARLHPILTQSIVRLFNSKQTNPKGAQLIFASHDTNLLTGRLFRRDQIWFTEKDNWGSTDLYSLSEYKLSPNDSKVRNDASFEKDYIRGRYGAIPFLSDFNECLGDALWGKE